MVAPVSGNMDRCMRGTRCKIQEERFVRCKRPLLADPVTCFLCEILAQVISLFWCLVGINGVCAFDKAWVELACFTSNKAVKVLKSTVCRPAIKGAHGAPFPGGDFMTFAKLRS